MSSRHSHRLALVLAVGAGALIGGPAAAASAQDSLTPADFQAAYSLPKAGAAHQTIAIVSAYDDPGAQSDLGLYTNRFKIPACTKAAGCFRQLNESGAASPQPAVDPTGGVFATESSVGIEIARGVCQSCSIMLVQASSPTKYDLSTAVRSAAAAGANVIVTSFDLVESPNDPQYAADYSSPKAIVVAASGDGGYGVTPYFPAALPGVIGVGGTQLELTASGRYRSETAWTQTTSGCSLYNPAPTWQTALAAAAGCGTRRAVVDLAAVADPGALVHIAAAGPPCGSAWCEAGGTSIAAPIIAGVIGLAGSAGQTEPKLLYEHAKSDPSAFRDITSGTTTSCQAEAICQARRGYDGPTGLGTPDGLAAFLRSGGALDLHRPSVAAVAPHNQVRVNRQWIGRLGLQNGNAFRVSSTVSLRSARPILVGAHRQTVTFASASLTLGPLASATVSLHIASRYRRLLTQLGSVPVQAALMLRGPAGHTVTATKRWRLLAP